MNPSPLLPPILPTAFWLYAAYDAAVYDAAEEKWHEEAKASSVNNIQQYNYSAISGLS